jgi:tight adherence protein C
MDQLPALTGLATQFGGGKISSELATALVLLFVGLVALVIGAGGLIFATDVIGRRLAAASGGPRGEAPALGLRQARSERRWFESLFTPTGERRSQTREKMIRAGFRGPAAVPIFYAARVGLTLAVPLLVSLTLPTLLRNLNFSTILLLTLMSAIVGFILPSAFVDRRIEQRQEAIRNGFPDALDMLLVCVEAGLGLDAALQRMSLEIGNAHPIIAEEFAFAAAEVRAGRSRIDSLRDLARRIAVDEVSAFVTVLSHSERFGSSVAETLRVYAAEMRQKRLVRAEEKANQLPIKLSLAVGFCTVPAMIILIMAPAIVTTVRGLGLLIRAL